MIVVDASAALAALLNAGPARALLARESLHAPQLVDWEVAGGLRRQVTSAGLPTDAGWAALSVWRGLGVTRYEAAGLLPRIWELRDNLSVYDAGYVALAEALDCALVTADGRLSRAPGVRCPVTVVPH